MAVKNMFLNDDVTVTKVINDIVDLYMQELLPADVAMEMLAKIYHRYHFSAEERGEDN